MRHRREGGHAALSGILSAALMLPVVSHAEVGATAEASREAIYPNSAVSVSELDGSAENSRALNALRSVPAIEKPLHRLRDGSLTFAPRTTVSPLSPAPNVNVLDARMSPRSFSSIKGFTGIHEGDNVTANSYELEPPDQGLAVNNNVAVEINNDVLRAFNATTGAPLTGPIANAKFFNAAAYSLTDTQAFFDPVSKRWFLDTVISSKTYNGYAVAVSQTSNALGKYYIYHLSAFSSSLSGCQSQNCFPDYPKAGYDADGLYITSDLFSNVSGNFVESAIFVLPKLTMETGAGFHYYRFDDPSDFVVQPSVPAPGEPFSTAQNGSEFLLSAPGSSTVAVLAIYNTNDIVSSGSSLRLRRTVIKSGNYGNGTVPSVEPDVVGPYCKSVGVTSAPTLDGGYSAFQATVQKAAGKLYAALAFGDTDSAGLNRDVLAWVDIQPTLSSTALTASLVHEGYVVPPTGYSISYPAFGLNKTGAGAMGMTITNKSASAAGGYPSAAFIQFTGTATTGSISVTGSGFTSDDGFTGCATKGAGQVGRWGDYGAATVDAATGYFYTANEMIPNPSTYTRGTYANWGTFVTQLH